MAITIPVDINTSMESGIDVAALKEELTRYAMKLIKANSGESIVTNVNTLYRTSPSIEALRLRGGRPVPADLKMEDIYAE